MKIIILILLPVILVADAEKKVHNENSLESSRLPAKLQQLAKESKVAIRSADANSMAASGNSTSDCNCQSSVVTYVRWGNSACPTGADMIYSGMVAGSWFAHEGAAVEPLCLPPDPQYLQYESSYQGLAFLYGAEYETNAFTQINQADQRNVPCVLCQVYGRTNKIMIPSRYECPLGWRREYYGYLMAGAHNNAAATQYTCLDEKLEQIPGSAGNNNGYLFHPVEAVCGHFIPCSD